MLNRWHRLWRALRVRPRLWVSGLLGGAAYAALSLAWPQEQGARALIAWNVFALLYLSLSAHMAIQGGMEKMRSRALVQDDGSRYVLVLAVVAAVVRLPLRILPGAMRDVLLIAPEPAVQERFRAVVAREATAAGLPRWKLHLARLGEGFDVELNFLVAPEYALPAAELDRLRARLEAGFGLPPQRLWLTVTITAEPRWT